LEDVIFLFLYHQVDAVTQRHFAQLRQFHPGALILPLTYRFLGSERLPGTIDVSLDSDHGWTIANPWMERDKIYLRWFLGPKRPLAQRYIFCEYDLCVQAPAEKFYGAAWNADVAGARVVIPQDAPQWPWWQQAAELEEAYPLRVGLSPLAASLWSHNALTRIARHPRFQHCFAELRIGTLARVAGLQLKEIPGATATISWRPEQDPSGKAAGWFHPVKH